MGWRGRAEELGEVLDGRLDTDKTLLLLRFDELAVASEKRFEAADIDGDKAPRSENVAKCDGALSVDVLVTDPAGRTGDGDEASKCVAAQVSRVPQGTCGEESAECGGT